MQQYTILFVEDVETCSEPLTRVLRRNGYRVLRAARVRQAVSLLEENNVDLILVDLALPDVGGAELIETIRATEEWRDLAVIVFSSWGEIDRMSRDLRISAWLTKSLASMKDLKQAIAEALRKTRR